MSLPALNLLAARMPQSTGKIPKRILIFLEEVRKTHMSIVQKYHEDIAPLPAGLKPSFATFYDILCKRLNVDLDTRHNVVRGVLKSSVFTQTLDVELDSERLSPEMYQHISLVRGMNIIQSLTNNTPLSGDLQESLKIELDRILRVMIRTCGGEEQSLIRAMRKGTFSSSLSKLRRIQRQRGFDFLFAATAANYLLVATGYFKMETMNFLRSFNENWCFNDMVYDDIIDLEDDLKQANYYYLMALLANKQSDAVKRIEGSNFDPELPLLRLLMETGVLKRTLAEVQKKAQMLRAATRINLRRNQLSVLLENTLECYLLAFRYLYSEWCSTNGSDDSLNRFVRIKQSIDIKSNVRSARMEED